ncbi:hypothetical protein HG717_33765 [Rhodococcus erythropolis]|uniref:hypothetical protein n=1 Tax=Rhodococcus erythropolis TaxID=1833 RepID=UPI001C9AA760|nr:hypothetical protein [Rhodococcus erythropolis]MBY6388840.1 hypothetical protein [Rhodococcus erythropolis]
MTTHLPGRVRGRMANIAAMKPCGYTLDVVAADAADAVAAAGGLMFDRIHSGWTARVFVLEDLDLRPLDILGAQGFAYDGIDNLALSRPLAALALSSAVLDRSEEIYQNTLNRLRRGCAEVTLWGDPPQEMQHHLVAMEHRLTPAAKAFKTSAWAACANGPVLQHPTERFHGLGTLCVPGNPDLTPVTVAVG